MSIKISYIVAAYNVADYIEHCARSLFEQTLEDIEVVFVDDASKDNSVAIIRRTLEDYPQMQGRVKIVQHGENKGTPDTRWDGLCEATGEFIVFIDGDDYVDSRMGELMYGKAVETGADMVLCGFWWEQLGGESFVMPVPTDALVDTQSIKDATLDRRGWPNVWCRMARRSLFEDKRMIWPVASHPEDLVITTAVTFIARSIAAVEEPLYHYRYNSSSLTNNNDLESALRKHDGFMRNNMLIEGLYRQNGVEEKYRRGIDTNRMYAKNELLKIPKWAKSRRLWLQTYPEFNRIMLFGNEHYKSTYREKVWFVVIYLGLFNVLQRVLFSKYFRPAFIWRVGLNK